LEDAEMTSEEQPSTEITEPIVEFPTLDENTYEAAKPHLKAALEYTIGLGRTVRDWGDFCVEKFGSTIVPYLDRFAGEVRDNVLRVDGWDAARFTLFGADLTPEEREQWIREAAYFRAEKRGFIEGSADEDWAEAEREVELYVEQQRGLLGRGRTAVLSLGDLATRGFDTIRESLGRWLEERPRAEEDKRAA
jgi:hypothetical protein